MRSNASILAALFLLAGFGGGTGYSNYAEAAATPIAAQRPVKAASWGDTNGAGQSRNAAEAWQQDLRRSAEPASSAPGASYGRPDARYGAPQDLPRPAPQDGYVDPTVGARGPSGSSRPGPQEVRYDEVGYAEVRGVTGGGAMDSAVVGLHRSLPANSFVEVTSLDNGRTILVLITGTMEPGARHPIDLSAGAARLLGAGDQFSIPVRIRRVNPAGMDRTALRSGRAATERPDTPPLLLKVLRKQLVPVAQLATPPAPRVDAPSPRKAPTAPAIVRPASGKGFYVQVAALSNAKNAQTLAQSMGGFVKPGGGLYRVQLGPFATTAQAQAARNRAAGAGYGDARVFAN